MENVEEVGKREILTAALGVSRMFLCALAQILSG
jgi:hypothetical protein